MDLMMVINLTETCSPNELTLKSYMSYTLALMDLMMVIKLTETCSPNKLT